MMPNNVKTIALACIFGSPLPQVTHQLQYLSRAISKCCIQVIIQFERSYWIIFPTSNLMRSSHSILMSTRLPAAQLARKATHQIANSQDGHQSTFIIKAPVNLMYAANTFHKQHKYWRQNSHTLWQASADLVLFTSQNWKEIRR